jgi:hypothetical protein
MIPRKQSIGPATGTRSGDIRGKFGAFRIPEMVLVFGWALCLFALIVAPCVLLIYYGATFSIFLLKLLGTLSEMSASIAAMLSLK